MEIKEIIKLHKKIESGEATEEDIIDYEIAIHTSMLSKDLLLEIIKNS